MQLRRQWKDRNADNTTRRPNLPLQKQNGLVFLERGQKSKKSDWMGYLCPGPWEKADALIMSKGSKQKNSNM